MYLPSGWRMMAHDAKAQACRYMEIGNVVHLADHQDGSLTLLVAPTPTIVATIVGGTFIPTPRVFHHTVHP